MTPSDKESRLNALRDRFHARAAGWWRVAGDQLEQVAFSPADDLPEAVAQGFAQATLFVSLDQTALGIVRAFVSGEPFVSRIDEVPGDIGSGLWLRRFGAQRSIAVPVRDESGIVVRVVSVALAGETSDDAMVARIIQAEAGTWGEMSDKFIWKPGELTFTQCLHCKHFVVGTFSVVCRAFPNAIPDEILTNTFDHRNPHPDEEAPVRFELKEALDRG